MQRRGSRQLTHAAVSTSCTGGIEGEVSITLSHGAIAANRHGELRRARARHRSRSANARGAS